MQTTYGERTIIRRDVGGAEAAEAEPPPNSTDGVYPCNLRRSGGPTCMRLVPVSVRRLLSLLLPPAGSLPFALPQPRFWSAPLPLPGRRQCRPAVQLASIGGYILHCPSAGGEQTLPGKLLATSHHARQMDFLTQTSPQFDLVPR